MIDAKTFPAAFAAMDAAAAQFWAYPDADSSEEVALTVSSKVIWCHVLDASLVNIARRDEAGGNKVS